MIKQSIINFSNTMMRFSFLRTFLCCLFFSLVLSVGELNAQVVSPIQSGHYLTTFTNIRDMSQAPPGFFVLLYDYYAFSDTYVDRFGNKHKSIELGDASIADMSINTFAAVPAFFWASKPKVFGATYMAGVVPNYISADATFLVENTGLIDGAAQTSTTKLSGWSDLLISPVTLTWGLKSFDLTFSYGVTAPTGRYKEGADDNLGMGYWSNQFQGYAYYYTSEAKTTALMLALTYELNGKTKGVDVSPGSRLALEWGWSQYVSERVELGIQGGSIWQVTDDKGSDVDYDPSVYSRANTVGFMAGYWAWKNKLQLIFKYNHDYGVRQGFRNNAFMLNAVFLTNLMTGSKKKTKPTQ